MQAQAMCGETRERAPYVNKVNSGFDSRSNSGALSRRQYSRQTHDKYKCGGCGRVHSSEREKVCKVWGKQCFKCSKFNHFASCCRGTRPLQRPVSSARFMDQEPNSDEEYCPSSRGVVGGSQGHEVQQTLDGDYSGEDVLPLHTVKSGKTVAPYLCTL